MKHRQYGIVLVLLLVLSPWAHAQLTLDWELDILLSPTHCVMDKAGNVYCTYANQSVSPMAILVTKVNNNGTLAWEDTWSSPGMGRALISKPILDTRGNIYVVLTQANPDGKGNFGYAAVRSYGPDGGVRWTTYVEPQARRLTLDGASSARPYALEPAISSDGVIFVPVYFTVQGAGCRSQVDRLFLFTLDESGGIHGYSEYDNGNAAWTSYRYDIPTREGPWRGVDKNDNYWLCTITQTDECYNMACQRIDPCDQEELHNALSFSTSATLAQEQLITKAANNISYDTWGTPSPSGSVYLVNFVDNTLAKYDASGEALWVIQTDPPGNRIYENPYNEDILFPDRNNQTLTCYDLNGSVKWLQDETITSSGAIITPVEFNSTGSYYGFFRERYSNIYHFCKVNSETGELIWQRSTPNGAWPNYTLHYLGVDHNGDLLASSFNKLYKFTMRTLTIKDAGHNDLPNQELYLIRVNNSSPDYTEDTLGVVRTDADGTIEITPLQ